MVYAFAVVWSWLIHGADTLGNVQSSALPHALVSSVKWLLSCIGFGDGSYNSALGGGAAVYSFDEFLSLDCGMDANQFAMLTLGAITSMIIAWGTMRLLVKILTLRFR